MHGLNQCSEAVSWMIVGWLIASQLNTVIMKAIFYVLLILLLSFVVGDFDDCSRDYSDDGGHFANSGANEDIKAPWLAAVGIGRESYDFFKLCSGSILTKKFILSAAHCFNSQDERYIPKHVRAGANNIESYFAITEQKEILKVEKHPDYDDYIYYFDIAIIEIVGEFKFSSRISPICLPESSSRHPGNGLGITVQGWGVSDTGNGKEVSEVTVSIRSRFECDDRIGMFGKSTSDGSENVAEWMPRLTTDILFCADATTNDKTGVCRGDSGGPAIFRLDSFINIFLVR